MPFDKTQKKIFAGAIHADHGQFYCHDAEWDQEEELFGFEDKWLRGLMTDGFYRTKSSVTFATGTQNDSHWIELYLAHTPPKRDDCQRLIVVSIAINSGELVIHGPSDWEGQYTRIAVDPRSYCLFFFAYNLGGEISSLGEPIAKSAINDETLLKDYSQLEHYKIVLVPGKCQKTGVIYSAPN
jgi:hypothetical protein